MQFPLLLAEVCMLYKGWTVEHCLKMPASRFFAMLKAGRRIQALERIEDTDIAMVPSCGPDYFKSVRSRFESRLKENETAEGNGNAHAAEQLTAKPGAVVLDAGSEDAREFMFNIFAAKKGLPV